MPDGRLEHRDVEREARLLDEGRQAIRDGLYIDDADLDAWLDGLDEDPNLEIPQAPSSNSSPRR